MNAFHGVDVNAFYGVDVNAFHGIDVNDIQQDNTSNHIDNGD